MAQALQDTRSELEARIAELEAAVELRSQQCGPAGTRQPAASVSGAQRGANGYQKPLRAQPVPKPAESRQTAIAQMSQGYDDPASLFRRLDPQPVSQPGMRLQESAVARQALTPQRAGHVSASEMNLMPFPGDHRNSVGVDGVPRQDSTIEAPPKGTLELVCEYCRAVFNDRESYFEHLDGHAASDGLEAEIEIASTSPGLIPNHASMTLEQDCDLLERLNDVQLEPSSREPSGRSFPPGKFNEHDRPKLSESAVPSSDISSGRPESSADKYRSAESDSVAGEPLADGSVPPPAAYGDLPRANAAMGWDTKDSALSNVGSQSPSSQRFDLVIAVYSTSPFSLRNLPILSRAYICV